MRDRILQIYHQPDQKNGLIYEPFFNPPVPDHRYLFMESWAILKALNEGLHKNARYFGMLSPRFQEKYQGTAGDIKKFFLHEPKPFTKAGLQAKLNTSKSDIVALIRPPAHDFMAMAEYFHPGFERAMQTVLRAMGAQIVSGVCHQPIYFNYFLAREAVWNAFHVWLEEFINLFSTVPSLKALGMADSGYQRPWPEHFKSLFGIDYWPMFPFLAERLIMAFINNTYGIRS